MVCSMNCENLGGGSWGLAGWYDNKLGKGLLFISILQKTKIPKNKCCNTSHLQELQRLWYIPQEAGAMCNKRIPLTCWIHLLGDTMKTVGRGSCLAKDTWSVAKWLRQCFISWLLVSSLPGAYTGPCLQRKMLRLSHSFSKYGSGTRII